MCLASISVVASTLQNFSHALVLADENILTRFAEVKGMNIKWELVGWVWYFTWVIELEMEKCFSGVSKVLSVVKKTAKQPTNNSDLRNGEIERFFSSSSFILCFFKPSKVCLDCVKGRVPSPAVQKHVSHLWGVNKAEHCSYLEDGLMVLFLTQSFSQLFCSNQGVNPNGLAKFQQQQFRSVDATSPSDFEYISQHCLLILSYCERLFLKNSCFTCGWGIWKNSLQAQAK